MDSHNYGRGTQLKEICYVMWTGDKMIVWGGSNLEGKGFSAGGTYDPEKDKWMPITTKNAPIYSSIAVWTGKEMVVFNNSYIVGIYNPENDEWKTIPITPEDEKQRGEYRPLASWNYTLVCTEEYYIWDGYQVIIWGYEGPNKYGDYLTIGWLCDTKRNKWVAITKQSAPSPRRYQTAVWTGRQMIVWGGCFATISEIGPGAREMPTPLNTGGIYDPSQDK